MLKLRIARLSAGIVQDPTTFTLVHASAAAHGSHAITPGSALLCSLTRCIMCTQQARRGQAQSAKSPHMTLKRTGMQKAIRTLLLYLIAVGSQNQRLLTAFVACKDECQTLLHLPVIAEAPCQRESCRMRSPLPHHANVWRLVVHRILNSLTWRPHQFRATAAPLPHCLQTTRARRISATEA